MEKDQEEEFKYSQCDTFNDADPTPKNLLATVPKLNCFILKRTENKGRSEATNIIHAKLVLNNVNGIFGNIERNAFSFNFDGDEGLSDCGLFFLKRRFVQQQNVFTVNLFGCSKTKICLFIEEFQTNKNSGFLRTSAESALLFLYQYHEASRGAAAEHNDMNQNHIGRQSQDDESLILSIHGTICKNLEIEQRILNEEYSAFSLNNFANSNLKAQVMFVLEDFMNEVDIYSQYSEEELHHSDEEDRLVGEAIASDGSLSIFFRSSK
jgi:hypothetical protein